jgi:hypothetical protein
MTSESETLNIDDSFIGTNVNSNILQLRKYIKYLLELFDLHLRINGDVSRINCCVIRTVHEY